MQTMSRTQFVIWIINVLILNLFGTNIEFNHSKHIKNAQLCSTMKKTNLTVLGLGVLTFALLIYVYPSLPAQMTTHWGLDGQPNGYMSKFWGTFFIPIISIAILGLFFLIPKIDPLKENIENEYHDNNNIIDVGATSSILFWCHWMDNCQC